MPSKTTGRTHNIVLTKEEAVMFMVNEQLEAYHRVLMSMSLDQIKYHFNQEIGRYNMDVKFIILGDLIEIEEYALLDRGNTA